MFQASAAPQPMVRPLRGGSAAPPNKPPPGRVHADVSGRPRRLSRWVRPAPPAARPPAPPKQAAAGRRLRRMFQTPAAPQPMGEVAPAGGKDRRSTRATVLGGSKADLPHRGGISRGREFTRFFQSPPLSRRRPLSRSFPRTVGGASSPPVSSAPGEFTRDLRKGGPCPWLQAGSSAARSSPRSPAPRPPPAGEYYAMFLGSAVVQPQRRRRPRL